MLLSLLKILFFLAVVLAGALGLMRLQETGQTLLLEFADQRMELGPIQILIGLVLLMIASWVAFKLLGLALAFLRFLAGDETAISRYFDRSRERKGYEALGEGMLAVAAGEGKQALAKAARAEKYLDKPHVTNLLTAQAAEVAGDKKHAGQVYRKLLEDDRTRFVGVRGLMKQKLDEGDTTTALQLAQKAYGLKPGHAEVQNTLLELQTKEGDWKGARGVLKDKRRSGELPKDVHIRRDAVLALQEAGEVLAKGNSISAREAAISANRASPDLIPAAVLAARSYMAKGDPRNAGRVLEKTWSVRPHPDVAAAYAEIAPDETPAARLKRFDGLIRKNAKHDESRLLKAELLLAAEDFPGARRALGDLAETQPTVRSLSIMAAVERGEGSDDSVVRGWLARALTASRGPQWVCDKCENVMAEWAPVCDKCGGFDTLSWRTPVEKRAAHMQSGAEMLPLLVGPSSAEAKAEGDGETARDVSPAKPADIDAPQPGMVPTEAQSAAAQAQAASGAPAKPAAPAPESPTQPGMVPRERDMGDKPASPEEASAKASPAVVTPPEPAKADQAPAIKGDQTIEAQPIRTAEFDVPAREAENRGAKRGDKGPVRPDVEPSPKPGKKG